MPGLFYLVALTAIAESGPGLGAAFAEVVTYNAIWFSVPIAAAVLAWRRPGEARALMGAANDWARRHRETLLVALFAAVGTFLTLKGASGLLGSSFTPPDDARRAATWFDGRA